MKDDQDKNVYPTPEEIRRAIGEAWMMCDECGAKLYSFDGNLDASRSCPYKRNGKCEL